MSVDVEAAYREHADYVRGWCYTQTGNAAEADDLASAVWERLARRADRIADVNVRGYLTVTIRNLAADRVRRARIVQFDRLPELDGAADRKPGEMPAVEDAGSSRHLDQFEANRAVALLDRLPPRQRAVLEARFLHGLTVAETCALLGVGRKALKGLTYRGTRELRERLEATA